MAKKQIKKVKKSPTSCMPYQTAHKAYFGMCMLVLGVLIILNSVYGWLNWGVFIGGIIGIKGILFLMMPCCK